MIIFDDVFYQAILKIERWGEVSLVRKYLLRLVGSSLLPVHTVESGALTSAAHCTHFQLCYSDF
jgi:hypothetical protein